MRKLLITMLLLCLQTACSQADATFENDVKAVCAVYSSESMEATAGMDLLEKFEYVNTKIRNTIKTKELSTIFDELALEGNADFYGALQNKISTQLGKEWTCENAKAFYAISWQRVDSLPDAKVVEVNIVDGQFFEINGTNYVFSEVEKIQSAINSAANGEEFKLQLNVQASTSKEELNNYLDPLRKIGIKNLSIAEVK